MSLTTWIVRYLTEYVFPVTFLVQETGADFLNDFRGEIVLKIMNDESLAVM